MPKNLLLISGHDCSGFSGRSADLRTAAALDVFALPCLTCATSQNSIKVNQVFPLSIDLPLPVVYIEIRPK